ncbi:MAG: hypothetical protein DLM65_12475 [Candidatus Aeolococcus gillhamiae]|nr:MAG: hypothetical protein DLM65_12475 [Candidatus Dormibacter sp. RRmetagenome_bin12]
MPAAARRTGLGGRSTSIMAACGLVASLLIVTAPSALAATLTNNSWTVSNNQVSAANVNYGYSFKTATTGTIKSITFVVSGANLGGVPAIVTAYGIGAGSVTRAGQTITYTVTAAVSVSAGIPIFVEFSGVTNPSPGGAYTTAITTQTATPTTIDTVSPGPSVTFAASNTAKTIVVAKSLTFTVDTTAFTLALDPSLPALADQSQVINLTVLTNANSGYTLTVKDLATHLQSAATGNPTIPQVSAGKATSLAWPGAPNTGYTVTGTGATIDAAFSASKFAGYTSAGEVVATRANATGATADTFAITDRTAIDYSVQATTFTDTLTYTVTPNYT